MRELEERMGYSFHDPSLLKTALSHSSYANEILKDGLKSYERLEFLGDSILGFVTADYLLRTFPELHEGNLTRLRADLVCEKSLASTAEQLRLGDYLLLSHGEESGGGRKKISIIADLVESVIAAIYLDGGLEEAKRFIYRFVLVDTEKRIRMNEDFKTRLQELVQQRRDQVLTYHLLSETGPDHDKQFTVQVRLNGKSIGEGSGTSKKRAEQAAAEQGLALLRQEKTCS